ncbi:tRNA (adenosine(37)-N6)-threonylcarbamoyltransferase complex dimerization subunit type 1 TsaB [Pseudoflavitalea sp. G-6-1-2]|uniref:tRNA (adenosine(37)-N6)-threonylcarbamoyltransferase complex dimerization subunit type 1 TsaB n=1 Tax=Pseudoflavitalea sp. G-6-1-2 TaxID=2728841 RepID=UPI00146DE977|nr:tRNA (adenosine(37)-N6)-threonylcarbamoyltransferase complex dimerization subunit type 1 TsaB [Pseudoflavitalea sp. G-6-1-2]NML19686.1 tRNA (adenosine(37)-N6)-threonylcarbamoyltransferase complex dimerization subunit type 1 TsaB [Pseudoflavitalea sp. G-6-1-2]
MAILLNIDTATESASICLAKDGVPVHTLINNQQRDHAAWIQPAIQQLLEATGYTMKDIQGVGVTAGPGSYTGLRVGMATAKGLCYALGIPLITENTLKVMAHAALQQCFPNGDEYSIKAGLKNGTLICPMIDARRMEVFTALYDLHLNIVKTPTALILEDGSFNKELENNSILFLGNGSAKWKPVCDHPHAFFADVIQTAEHLAPLADVLFMQEKFASLAYEEPVYLKEFYTYVKK